MEGSHPQISEDFRGTRARAKITSIYEASQQTLCVCGDDPSLQRFPIFLSSLVFCKILSVPFGSVFQKLSMWIYIWTQSVCPPVMVFAVLRFASCLSLTSFPSFKSQPWFTLLFNYIPCSVVFHWLNYTFSERIQTNISCKNNTIQI